MPNFRKQIQYQRRAQVPRPETPTEDRWHQPWSEPVRQKIAAGLAIALVVSSGLFAPVFTPTASPTTPTGAIPSTDSVNVQYEHRFQYQAKTEPVFVGETITADKWIYPWFEPVRQKLGLLAQFQQAFTEVLEPNTQVTQNYESRWHQGWSEPVRFKPKLPAGEQQFFAGPLFIPEVITEDKWHQAWSEPVRQKVGIKFYLQQPFTTDTAAIPTSNLEPWFNPLSEPIRIRPQLPVGEQQVQAYAPFIPETITEDKWHYPLSEPVRQKIGLGVHHQQFSAFVLDDETQIIQTYESRWHYAWSEPVRIKLGLLPSAQQFIAQTPFVTETITLDKWYEALTEPVRQKIGQKSHLQQDFIGTVLEPNSQITQTYESRWHYAWSEPVRFRQFPAAEQQAFTFQPPSFEIVTPDKWTYSWSEPVRQRPGLKPYLQQTTAQTVLDPDTQITQGYESRWHQGWSEPVRSKRGLLASEHQSYASAIFIAETITVDKWIYPWSEPVRTKLGLRTSDQQFSTADTAVIPTSRIWWLSPLSEPTRTKPPLRIGSQQFIAADTTVIPTSKLEPWFAPLSEPVRLKRGLPASEQQFISFQPAIEIITPDKWIYPWSEPVRQKVGLRAYLQQAFIGIVLDPNTQITQDLEPRWHQGWSEPVRFRQLAVAQQQSHTEPPTSVFETIEEDKWHYPWSEPVRFRIDPKRAIALAAPFAAGPVLDPNTQITQNFESRWHYAWSEPVRVKINPQRAVALAASGLFAPVLNPETQIIQTYESRWHQPWSEPKRFKQGLGAWLQQVATPATPPFPNFVKTINWFAPLNEPVKVKQWLHVSRMPFFWTTPESILADVFVTLSATEVNTDSAVFGVSLYKRANICVVSIKEIQATRRADLAIVEIPAVWSAAASIEETPSDSRNCAFQGDAFQNDAFQVCFGFFPSQTFVSIEEKPNTGTGDASIEET